MSCVEGAKRCVTSSHANFSICGQSVLAKRIDRLGRQYRIHFQGELPHVLSDVQIEFVSNTLNSAMVIGPSAIRDLQMLICRLTVDTKVVVPKPGHKCYGSRRLSIQSERSAEISGLSPPPPIHQINVINYHRPIIYLILGISTQQSLMILGIGGDLSIVYCTIGLALLDCVGRVKPLIVSARGHTLALVVNATLSQHRQGAGGNQLRAMVALNFVFSLFYTPMGIIPWVHPAEILAKGNFISTFVNWTLNLVFAQISPRTLTNIGFKYFYLFFIFGIIAALCYIFFYPETKGKTLEQMDELFGDQLVHHVLEDPTAAESATGKAIAMEHHEVDHV